MKRQNRHNFVSTEVGKGSMYQDILIKTYGKLKATKILKNKEIVFTKADRKKILSYKGI